jgi:RNA polymerase sigma factor RpoE
LRFPGSSATPIELLELDFVPGAAFARAPEQLGYTEARLSGANKNQPQGYGEGRRMSEREIDQQLVERAQQGDKHAFELLVSKYQRKLGRLLSRFIRDPGEVEDVTQEAFIKAYRALPSFRGDSAFYTWLYRIGINTAKNYLVSMGRRAPTITNYDAEEAEGFDDGDQLRDLNTPENLLMSKQIAQTVNQSMDRLPEELRAAIMLREIEGMSYEDIAKIMNCPIGTVRSRIFRAREAIAEELRPLLDLAKDKRW